MNCAERNKKETEAKATMTLLVLLLLRHIDDDYGDVIFFHLDNTRIITSSYKNYFHLLNPVVCNIGGFRVVDTTAK
jgi:hypothetical protein